MGYYKPVLANSGHCSLSVEEKNLNSAEAGPRLLLWASGKTFHGKKTGLWSQKVLVSEYLNAYSYGDFITQASLILS